MGNNQSGEDVAFEVVKKVGSVALAVSYFTPAAAFTIPVTVAAGTIGAGTEIAGHITDNDNLKKAGSFYRKMVTDAAVDGISGGAIDRVKECGQTIKLIKTGCEAYSSARDEVVGIPTPDPQMTLFVAKNIKNIF